MRFWQYIGISVPVFCARVLGILPLAGAITASKFAGGRVATVAIDGMSFMVPVKVGSLISCYTEILSVGRSSIQIQVEVWTDNLHNNEAKHKVTEGTFVFVAIDGNGNNRAIQ